MNLAVYGNGLADVMNHVDCVINRDLYPHKIHVLKISVVYHFF